MNDSPNSILSKAEVAAYHKEGILIPRFRLTDTRVENLRDALEKVIRDNPRTRPERLVSVHISKDTVENVKGDDIFLEIAKDPQIVTMVSQVIGPDVILWGCQAFCKPAGTGMEVPWHQDGHYWPIRPLATCTVWIAIDDSFKENGCLRVIPGSHRPPRLVPHHKEDRKDVVLNQRIRNADLDLDSARDIELEAGQLSLHDVYMVHGSNANSSTRRRAGLAIRYMPGTSLFDRELKETNASAGYTVDFANRPIWLLSGEDQTGKNDFEIGH